MIGHVSDTAFWVAYYRARESERADALFQDRLAKKLVGERGSKVAESMPAISRYTEWSVISRTVIIDRFIDRLVKDGADTVINLGAGLDTRPYRMSLPESLEWVEVDHPSIIAHKTEILGPERPGCRLSRVAVDLADDVARGELLDSILRRAEKAVVLTEGVIPYLSPEQVTDLARDLFARKQITWWIAEYFDPRVYRHLKNTVRAAAMRNAPFRFYPEDWFGFFRKLGWVEQETRYTGDIAVEFNRKLPMPRWAELIFPFLPRKIREKSLRMTGYVVFEKDRT